METKQCLWCKKVLSIQEFHYTTKERKNKRCYCKECGRGQRRGWRDSKKDGYWYVYYLPEEHYVGITSLIGDRMNTHFREGRIIDDYEIIAKYNHPALALMTEALFHYCGYEGCNYK
jgi:hypothetical protein